MWYEYVISLYLFIHLFKYCWESTVLFHLQIYKKDNFAGSVHQTPVSGSYDTSFVCLSVKQSSHTSNNSFFLIKKIVEVTLFCYG